MPGRMLLITFPESAPSLYAAVTDSLGRYFIAAGFRQNGTEGVVRLMEPDQEAMILPEDEFPDDALPDLDLIPPMEGMEALFRELLVVQQINSTYGISHDTAWTSEDRPPALFGSYDQVIVMEDYISLPVMEEVFRELGKSVLLIRNGDGYHVRLVDRQTNRVIGGSPLYLLDGVPFTDPGILMQLDPSRLKEIRFKCSRYFLQDLVMDGIIDIRSLSGEYLPPELAGSLVRFPCRGLPAEEHAFRPDRRAMEEDHIPLVMNTLYVNPHYTYRGGETNTLQWIAPDSKGTWDIVVRVVDADGHAGEAIRSFRVE